MSEETVQPQPLTRQQMIDFLANSAYPLHKGKRAVGYSVFVQALEAQPAHCLVAMYDSAIRERDFRAELRKARKRRS